MFKGTKKEFEQFFCALTDLHKEDWKRAMTETEIQEFEPFVQVAQYLMEEESPDRYVPRRVLCSSHGDLKIIFLKLNQTLAASGKASKTELRYEVFLFKGPGLWGHCQIPTQTINSDITLSWSKCIFKPSVPGQNSKTVTYGFQKTAAL